MLQIRADLHRAGREARRKCRASARSRVYVCGEERLKYSAGHRAWVLMHSTGSGCEWRRSPQTGLNQCRLQEATSLEGDSLAQTHAGTFKPPTQRDREKLFSARFMCWCRLCTEPLVCWSRRLYGCWSRLCADPLVYRANDMPSRLYSEPPIQCEPPIQSA